MGGDGVKSKIPLMSRFIIFSLVLYAVILVGGSTAFVVSMRQIIRNNKGNELERLTEVERIRLETLVNTEIAVVLSLADSPFVREYFMDPTNPDFRENAMDEIESYRHSLSSHSVFWANDIDRLFYIDDAAPYYIDADDPVNYWYNMTMYETETYNFNINYNPDLKVTRLWINAPVFADSGKTVGIVGAGVELDVFVASVFEYNFGRLEYFLVNKSGEITGARDHELMIDKRNINEELNRLSDDKVPNITGLLGQLKEGEVAIYDYPNGRIAIGTIPLLGWYSVAVFPDSIADYNTSVTTLFLVVIVVIAILFIVFNLFIAGLLKPFRITMEELEYASKAKSDFLSTMSHEMRTPLNAIIGMTAICKKSKGIDEMNYALDKIEVASAHLLGVINDVLDMSKIEANKLELSPYTLDFEQMLQEVVTVIHFRMDEKRQRFTLNVDDRIPNLIVCDGQRMEQIITNLLSNAVKFTPEGGEIVLEAELEKVYDEDGGMICISVTDSGIGISDEQQEKLFSAFTQAESGISREYGGTGLGLAISKRIVELMGGYIWVESKPGEGARFAFTAKVGFGQSDDLTEHGEVGGSGEATFEGKRLLLVEDVEINREIVLSLLSDTGLIIDVAENGAEAVKKVQSASVKYDMVFMDMQMPIMDGLEAARQIRALEYPYFKELPIIAMTANVFREDIDNCINAGMNDHVGKPLNIDTVKEKLREYLL